MLSTMIFDVTVHALFCRIEESEPDAMQLLKVKNKVFTHGALGMRVAVTVHNISINDDYSSIVLVVSELLIILLIQIFYLVLCASLNMIASRGAWVMMDSACEVDGYGEKVLIKRAGVAVGNE